ncbi:MAG: hypothetical protein EZS28_005464 [Streblomastix strix]|uniref:Uncharacterized protein n=1 Tax=Streblomastix strix TaxID=222440 RepID=A0A5J4WXB1_9EUKA|nr:MAG: hypothetical protein EZS28_005464 [Streblomastix strix]
MNDQKLSDNVYAVQMNPDKCKCKTPLQVAYFVLDNAKYCFISQKEILTQRIGLYLAIQTKVINNSSSTLQRINNFTMKNAKYFFPTIEGDLLDEKKILGLAIEREGTEMIALAPKNYYIMVDDKTKIKLKGINQSTNKIIKAQIVENIVEGTITMCINMRLGQKSYQMSKLAIEKNSITRCHTKAILMLTLNPILNFSLCLDNFIYYVFHILKVLIDKTRALDLACSSVSYFFGLPHLAPSFLSYFFQAQ